MVLERNSRETSSMFSDFTMCDESTRPLKDGETGGAFPCSGRREEILEEAVTRRSHVLGSQTRGRRLNNHGIKVLATVLFGFPSASPSQYYRRPKKPHPDNRLGPSNELATPHTSRSISVIVLQRQH